MDNNDIMNYIPKIVGFAITIMVGVIIFNQATNIMNESMNASTYSWEDDYEEYKPVKKKPVEKKVLPLPQDTNQYETEELDYDNILDDLGQEIMDSYEVNITSDYDESLGDILGGI